MKQLLIFFTVMMTLFITICLLVAMLYNTLKPNNYLSSYNAGFYDGQRFIAQVIKTNTARSFEMWGGYNIAFTNAINKGYSNWLEYSKFKN